MKTGSGWLGAVESQLSAASADGWLEGLLSLRERNKVRGSD
jgi:hypothetical protein